MSLLRFSVQFQNARVSDAVRARFGMVIPILKGMLVSTNRAMVEALGGYRAITLEQFARIYQEHPGDYGICFEYAVHEAVRLRDTTVYPLLSTALEDFCGIKGGAESILFGAEKSGATNIVSSAGELLTDHSVLLDGHEGRDPPRLRPLLDTIVRAFRAEGARAELPASIRGVWKADLFLGSPAPDQWVATTLKTNRRAFEAARGLRIGMYPEERPGKIHPYKDGRTNLVMCPLPYSSAFMELFGAAFQIVKQLIHANARVPSRVALVYDDDQQVAKWLADRREFAMHDIIDALQPIKQPDILTIDDFLEALYWDLIDGKPFPPDFKEIYSAVAPVPIIER